MKSSAERTHEGQRVKPDQPAISERKLRANRENARKSTGPRTLSGKAYSRQNALKHGLFSMHLMGFISLGEDPEEYPRLLCRLIDQYQPIGMAEQLEVERVALCWWRLKRAWRYENSVVLAAQRDFGQREQASQANWCKERDKEEEAVILQLEDALEEIEAGGEISDELKQKMFGTMPALKQLWPLFESAGQEVLNAPGFSNVLHDASSAKRGSVMCLCTAVAGISFLKQRSQWRSALVKEITTGQYVIPDREALDKILRYEITIERSLTRALDRLDRLQQDRKEEAVPLP